MSCRYTKMASWCFELLVGLFTRAGRVGRAYAPMKCTARVGRTRRRSYTSMYASHPPIALQRHLTLEHIICKACRMHMCLPLSARWNPVVAFHGTLGSALLGFSWGTSL
ncbi:hypothetical protein F4818DRAFT_214268 [Hypoxylon cercidicola]|nr:hypothetical protein F4818DRAFT_214268 [Hypoxylon cercidicola]